MMDKLVNWAIFGAMAVVWGVGFTWTMENYAAGDHVGYMFVTIFTISMMAGKTEGSNGLEHTIDGFKTCVVGLLGWALAAIVYTIISQLTMGDGFNVMGIIDDVVQTEVAFLTALMMSGSFNAVRD